MLHQRRAEASVPAWPTADAPGSFAAFLEELHAYVIHQEKTRDRISIIEELGHLRLLAAQSPFVHRAQTWPRGCVGDFETIQYIIDGVNKAQPGTPGHELEEFFLRADICAQHRYKIAAQSRAIAEVLMGQSAASILSIGCGGSEDLQQNISAIVTGGAHITLVDADADAIACSVNALTAAARRITPRHGNIYRIIRSLTGPYDLILMGGVADYLSDRTLCVVLRGLRHHLLPGGALFFTNIDAGNPYRIAMEYLANWLLIERSEAQLRHIAMSAGWPASGIAIQEDPTGLSHLITLAA